MTRDMTLEEYLEKMRDLGPLMRRLREKFVGKLWTPDMREVLAEELRIFLRGLAPRHPIVEVRVVGPGPEEGQDVDLEVVIRPEYHHLRDRVPPDYPVAAQDREAGPACLPGWDDDPLRD